MQLESLVTPTLIAAALAAVTGGAAKVWQLFQQGRLDCLERCATLTLELKETREELKRERLDHLSTLKLSVKLQTKYDAACGKGSNPP